MPKEVTGPAPVGAPEPLEITPEIAESTPQIPEGEAVPTPVNPPEGGDAPKPKEEIPEIPPKPKREPLRLDKKVAALGALCGSIVAAGYLATPSIRMEEQVYEISARLDYLEQEIGRLEDSIYERVDGMEKREETLSNRMEERVSGVDKRLSSLISELSAKLENAVEQQRDENAYVIHQLKRLDSAGEIKRLDRGLEDLARALDLQTRATDAIVSNAIKGLRDRMENFEDSLISAMTNTIDDTLEEIKGEIMEEVERLRSELKDGVKQMDDLYKKYKDTRVFSVAKGEAEGLTTYLAEELKTVRQEMKDLEENFNSQIEQLLKQTRV